MTCSTLNARADEMNSFHAPIFIFMSLGRIQRHTYMIKSCSLEFELLMALYSTTYLENGNGSTRQSPGMLRCCMPYFQALCCLTPLGLPLFKVDISCSRGEAPNQRGKALPSFEIQFSPLGGAMMTSSKFNIQIVHVRSITYPSIFISKGGGPLGSHMPVFQFFRPFV